MKSLRHGRLVSFKKLVAFSGFLLYVAYLFFTTWGAGMLSMTIEEEIIKINCVSECRAKHRLGKRFNKSCEIYCKKKDK